MAELSTKKLGIGLASSLLVGAISVTAATGVSASTAARVGVSFHLAKPSACRTRRGESLRRDPANLAGPAP